MDCPNSSAGYAYQWSPSTGLSDSHVLTPNVFITADTVVYTLTVTAPDGGTSSKAFTVIKIPYANLHLTYSNLHPCIGDTLTLTLSGTDFTPVRLSLFPTQQLLSSTSGGSTFNSLTDTIKIRFNSNHLASIMANPANPNFCLPSQALNITTPTGTATTFQYDTACLNSTYQFPDGTTATVVGDSIQHVSQITCSLSITTIVRTAPTYLINRSVNICRGNSYTFEDGTVAPNIQDTTIHQSHFSTIIGCDSIVQTKVIPVSLPAYTSDTTVVHLCSGVSYTFLDGTSFTASNNFDHVNHFTTQYGCDSISITRIVVYPTYRSNLFATVCNGGSYTFADGVTQTNITSNITHVSNFQTINGCDSIITENIAAQIIPAPNTQPVSVCFGSNFALPNGSTVFNLQRDTTIDITYPNSNGCNIRDIITLSVIDTDTSVQLNGLIFSANNTPGYAYQWINCISNTPIIGANGNSYLVTVAGDYAVEITNGSCKDTSSCYTITTQQIANGGRLIANTYPNPTRDVLQLDIQSDETSTASVNVYNMNGFLIVQATYALQRGNNHYSIPMERFGNGQYQIMITRADGIVVRKSFLKL